MGTCKIFKDHKLHSLNFVSLWKLHSWSFIQFALGIMWLPAQNIASKMFGKIIPSPCNFENAQVALRWPNRYTFYSNAFFKHFYRSKSTLDRLKVFSMCLGGNRLWLFLRLWLKIYMELSKLQEVIMHSPMSMFTPRDKNENLCLVRPSLRLHFPALFFFLFFYSHVAK